MLADRVFPQLLEGFVGRTTRFVVDDQRTRSWQDRMPRHRSRFRKSCQALADLIVIKAQREERNLGQDARPARSSARTSELDQSLSASSKRARCEADTFQYEHNASRARVAATQNPSRSAIVPRHEMPIRAHRGRPHAEGCAMRPHRTKPASLRARRPSGCQAHRPEG